MKWALFLGCLLLMGCTAIAKDSSTPSPPGTETITGGEDQSARFKLRLTITAPDDLKVKEGEQIVPGQILADRVRDRSRLTFQRDQLTREIARLKELANLPIPSLKRLPDSNFAEESAAIEHLKHRADLAEQRRQQQQRKLDLLATMPQNELPEAVIPHEQVLLDERTQEVNQAQAEVELARGKLAKARELRLQQEYAHSLEVSKRAISIQEHTLKTQGQIADLEARLSQIEVSLSQLSAVRSPYSGTIQRIKLLGQDNQNLSVELVMVVSSRNGFIKSNPQTSSSSNHPTPETPTSNGTDSGSSSPGSSPNQ